MTPEMQEIYAKCTPEQKKRIGDITKQIRKEKENMSKTLQQALNEVEGAIIKLREDKREEERKLNEELFKLRRQKHQIKEEQVDYVISKMDKLMSTHFKLNLLVGDDKDGEATLAIMRFVKENLKKAGEEIKKELCK